MQITEDIYRSGDGYLFLTGGHHQVADYMSGRARPTPASVAAFFANQAARRDWCRAAGIQYSMWIFPDKLHALREQVPELGSLRSLYLSRYREDPGWAEDMPVFYPDDIFDRQTRLFTVGDTHYAPRGEIEVTTRILDTVKRGLGAEFRAEALAAMTGRRKQVGDLGKKLPEPLVEKVKCLKAPLRPFQQVKNGIPGNNGTLILIDSPEARIDRTLLIFGDSFFRVMLEHLAWAFRRIVFCRTPFFHYELVRAVRPDVILGGAAERYMADCQPDASRPHFLSYSLLAGRPMKPERGFDELFARYFDQSELI